MLVTVDLKGNKKRVKLKNNAKVLDLLKELNINRETAVCKRDDMIITEFEKLHEKDKIEIISVISGG